MRWLALVLLGLLIGLQVRLWMGEGSLAELQSLRHEIQHQQAAIQRFTARNRTLQAAVEDLRAGQEALEERARSELGMIQEGELFIQVLESPRTGEARGAH